jgi:hypothetical protein
MSVNCSGNWPVLAPWYGYIFNECICRKSCARSWHFDPTSLPLCLPPMSCAFNRPCSHNVHLWPTIPITGCCPLGASPPPYEPNTSLPVCMFITQVTRYLATQPDGPAKRDGQFTLHDHDHDHDHDHIEISMILVQTRTRTPRIRSPAWTTLIMCLNIELPVSP